MGVIKSVTQYQSPNATRAGCGPLGWAVAAASSGYPDEIARFPLSGAHNRQRHAAILAIHPDVPASGST